MRLFGVAAGLGMVLGCTSSSTFICSSDDECLDGRCETNGYCSFPSDDCDGGWAYGEFSAPTLAGSCVDDGPSAQTEGSTTAPSSDTDPTSTSTTSPPDPSVGVSSNATLPEDSGSTTDTTNSTDTGQTTAGGAGFELCSDYSILIGKCIDPAEARDALVMCVESYSMYMDSSDEDCVNAFIDVLSCLSALDCAELESGKSVCEAQLLTFNMVCMAGP